MNEAINVVLTSSEYYVPYTYVLMQSVLENTEKNVHFYILSNDISEKSIKSFENLKLIKPCNVTIKNVDLSSYPVPKQHRAHSIVYAKLNLPTFLPELKKCIVLDSDMIVTCDLNEIYEINLENKYVAWVPDQLDITIETNPYWLDAFKIPETQYINSGLLILNLEEYRQDNIEQKLLQNYDKYKESIRFYDQDLLYITLSKKCIYLDYIYNYMQQLPYSNPKIKKYCQDNCKIIHYGCIYKPWFYPDIEKAEIWWAYARKTPYYEIILQRLFHNNYNELGKIEEDIETEVINPTDYKKFLYNYWKYKILKNFVFGAKKERYKLKKELYKNNLIKIKEIIKQKGC